MPHAADGRGDDAAAQVYRYVRNAQILLSHGQVTLRRHALQILDHALDRTNPYRICRDRLRLTGDALFVDEMPVPLPADSQAWFFGAGKASLEIARAVEDLLGPRLAGGLVICKHGQEGQLRRVAIRRGGHPIPDEAGARATAELLALLSRPLAGDLVIFGVTGGSSALMTCPCEGLTLADIQHLTQTLLTCGADIFEINAVRKHVSRVGGGRLVGWLNPEVRLLNLTVSDVIGDALDYITDLTVPDTSTIADARRTLDRYRLWNRVPPSVRDFLAEGGAASETPKTFARPRRRDVLLASSGAACEAARDHAEALGYQSLILSTSFAGESRMLGVTHAAIADEIVRFGRPAAPPCAIISGGETIVTMDGAGGTGGPNQEFTLAAALAAPHGRPIVFLGADSDGTDGPTEVAGALCDNEIAGHAERLGIDAGQALQTHDVTPALLRLGDAIVTGATGTNVNDLRILLVG